MEENKLFTPHPNKHLYTIVIKVMDNCCSLGVEPHEKKEISYHELVGVLSTQQMNLIIKQRDLSLKLLSKENKKLKKKT